MNPIMTITPIKSIKNAPTIGTTKYALGEFPYFLVITSNLPWHLALHQAHDR